MTVPVFGLDEAYWQPIDWKCRDCSFVLKAPSAREATMPAVGHYISTGHQGYQPLEAILH